MKKINTRFSNFKNNIMLILLVLGGIFNDFSLRALTLGDVFKLKPIITSISIILIISILALFLNYKNRNYVYIILSGIFGFISGANYLYYKHFNSFLSFSLLKQFNQIGEMKGSLYKTLDIKVLLFFIPTIVLILIFKRLKKLEFFQKIETTKYKKEVIRPFILGTVLLVMVYSTLTSTDISRLIKQWNRPYLVEQLGIYSYTTADFVKNTLANRESKKVDDWEFEGDLEKLVDNNNKEKIENEYTDTLKGKDVYVIHYESAQSFPMDLEFSSGQVTPFLNKMANEGLYFNNFYPQHSTGTSSDSEFSFSTSLLPVNNGTVFMTHADREYVSIQNLLKKQGYFTMAMHGNNRDFWNRNTMYKTLGYDEFFSKKDYEIDEEVGLGLSDKSFFTQSIDKIKEIKEEKDSPIMATLITLSNHFPFDDLDKYPNFSVDHLEDTAIGNYLKSYHYADMALQSFIENMDKEGLLDNAVVVLYGDHHAKISKGDYEKVYNYNKELGEFKDKSDPEYVKVNKSYLKQVRKTPLIVWTKDKTLQAKIDKPIGMIDVAPTIGNMLGVFNQYQMGHDIFNVEENKVSFPNGDFIDKNYYFSASSSKTYDLKTNELVEDKNISDKILLAKTDTEEQIDMSYNIVNNDLIKFYNYLLANHKVKTPENIEIKDSQS